MYESIAEFVDGFERSRYAIQFRVFNGWQLAKMKKSIPDMSLS